MTSLFDDHGISNDMDTDLQLDFPVLPSQQSVFDNLDNFEDSKEKMKKGHRCSYRAASEAGSTAGVYIAPNHSCPFPFVLQDIY